MMLWTAPPPPARHKSVSSWQAFRLTTIKLHRDRTVCMLAVISLSAGRGGRRSRVLGCYHSSQNQRPVFDSERSEPGSRLVTTSH
jgi:hypothetical protein